MLRRWQVLVMAALGISATLVAVPRALSGFVAAPQTSDPGVSRTAEVSETPRVSTATVPEWSPTPSASPSAADIKAPTTVVSLRVTSNTAEMATVTWDLSSDNVGVHGYAVRADGVTKETAGPPVSVMWGRRTSTLTLYVAAFDVAGNRSEWRSIILSPPKSPTATAAKATTAARAAATTTTATPTVAPPAQTVEPNVEARAEAQVQSAQPAVVAIHDERPTSLDTLPHS